jgi:hypothetical protein
MVPPVSHEKMEYDAPEGCLGQLAAALVLLLDIVAKAQANLFAASLRTPRNLLFSKQRADWQFPDVGFQDEPLEDPGG